MAVLGAGRDFGSSRSGTGSGAGSYYGCEHEQPSQQSSKANTTKGEASGGPADIVESVLYKAARQCRGREVLRTPKSGGGANCSLTNSSC